MILCKGRVWKFGDNIDTDVIFPSQYMLLPTLNEMKVHAFEPLIEKFSKKVLSGDIILAGENFGCGSSREQAPAVLKSLGIKCIIAKSFARIFYRNAINIGLFAIVCNECYESVEQGDILVVDFGKNTIQVEGHNGRVYNFKEFPPHITNMISSGGLIEFLNIRENGLNNKWSSSDQSILQKRGKGRGMTLTEKILARASGKDYVEPGEIVQAKIDLIMTNDATTHISIDIFENKVKNRTIAMPEKVIWVVDHNVPSESVETANVQKKQREFVRKHGLRAHDGEGICHQILIENYVLPGQVIVGADSHTCSYGAFGIFSTGIGSTDLIAAMKEGSLWFMIPPSLKFELYGSLSPCVTAKDLILTIIGDIGANGANYKAMEFSGEGLRNLSIESRITLANLTLEAGAKNGIMEVDDDAISYLSQLRGNKIKYDLFKSDPEAQYEKIFRYDLSKIQPVIAFPHTVDNVRSIDEAEGIKLDQVFVGSCSNGRLEDLRILAGILKGAKIAKNLRLIISPASRRVYLKALNEGLISIFLESGAMVVNPNCSTCWGGSQAVVGDGERLLSTGTRNFKGRSGSPTAEVYLASIYTAAASALAGKIVNPLKYLRLK